MSEIQTLKTRVGDIILDARKAAYLPLSETLLVADMHFEKGSYLREVGRSVLPAFDTQDTIQRLKDLAKDFKPKRIIALGDSFHDIHADERLAPESATQLNALSSAECEFIWILGNHDPDIPMAVEGRREDHVEIDGFLLTHHPHDPQSGVNICGHYHPKAKISSRAGSVTAPCFAISDDRIILPSFGTFTGGLFVTDPDFVQIMPQLRSVSLTYEERLFAISTR
ncbi:metallophosphatase [Litorimonas cladophorae]|uniref:Metallophosphatase n=1 Tax=Litorimonas cladophorae TaxID=1220491 RepID=A0A918NGI5_9PROT|nr:ligase-associated DNA damage response endonuclease PdeM [Litorimonas cladophorae]GGX71363.1 metallophosphatase [Litorimonas cladophorae]